MAVGSLSTEIRKWRGAYSYVCVHVCVFVCSHCLHLLCVLKSNLGFCKAAAGHHFFTDLVSGLSPV